MFRRNVPRSPTIDASGGAGKKRVARANSRRMRTSTNPFRHSAPSYATQAIYTLLGTVVALALMGFGAFLGIALQTPETAPLVQHDSSLLRKLGKHQHRNKRSSPHVQPPMVQLHGKKKFFEVSRVAPAPFNKEPYDWLVGEEWEGRECVPAKPWMLPTYSPSNCNALHEIELGSLESTISFISCGGSRCAFEVQDLNGNPFVMKFPKYNWHNTESEQYEGSWRDSISMERLSASPFVLNNYGQCGYTELVEIASGGSLHDQIKVARQYGDHMSPEDKLRIGWQVASAVADVHSCDSDKWASMSHNDLCCHQFLNVDGVYKLTDFHFASFSLFQKHGDTTCPEPPIRLTSMLTKTRAPEETRYRKYYNMDSNDENKKELENIHREKADVYLTGNILYYVLTKKWMYEGFSRNKAKEAILSGKTPEIPQKFLNSTNPADKALVKAIKMAWKFKPSKRATSRKIATFLRERLETLGIKGRGEDGIWRVSMPPLPANHSDTENDFIDNLYESSSSDDKSNDKD